MIAFHLPTDFFDFFLRSIVLLCRIVSYVYWRLSEIETEKAKSKRIVSHPRRIRMARWGIRLLYLLMVLQLIGLKLLPMTHVSWVVQFCGVVLAMSGTGIGILARKELGSNWVHAADFQIKKGQTLVTGGIYHFIRHPIYTSILLFIIGGELAANSWLVLPLGITVCIAIGMQAKREEQLLIAHFGNAYRSYMRVSKMLIPFFF